jgi:hypothetical protein
MPPFLQLLEVHKTESVKHSSITTGWARKARWDAAQCARDVFQNFFDAAIDNDIDIDKIEEHRINDDGFLFFLPNVVFDIKNLFWAGSEKDGKSTIGHVGEGFKLATLCLLRDYGVRIVAASGNQAVEIRISKNTVSEDSSLKPLEYSFFTLKKPLQGNAFLISNASSEVLDAISLSRHQFFYPKHPCLGKEIKINQKKKNVQIFHLNKKGPNLGNKKERVGLVFYKRQLKAFIPGADIVVVMGYEKVTIDRILDKDRDRNMASDSVRRQILDSACGKAFDLSCKKTVSMLLKLSEKSLPTGNVFLHAVAKSNMTYTSSEDLIHLSDDIISVGKKYLPATYIRRNSYHSLGHYDHGDYKNHTSVPYYMGLFGATDPYVEGEKKQAIRDMSSFDSAEKGTIVQKRALENICTFLKEKIFSMNAIWECRFSSNSYCTNVRTLEKTERNVNLNIVLPKSVFDKSTLEIVQDLFLSIADQIYLNSFNSSSDYRSLSIHMMKNVVELNEMCNAIDKSLLDEMNVTNIDLENIEESIKDDVVDYLRKSSGRSFIGVDKNITSKRRFSDLVLNFEGATFTFGVDFIIPINPEDALVGVIDRIKYLVDKFSVDITDTGSYEFSRNDGSYSISSFAS